MQYKIQILRSQRKSLALEIREPGLLLVRAPLRMSDDKICSFISDKEAWIQKHMGLAEQRCKSAGNIRKITSEEIAQLTCAAQEVIPPIVAQYAAIMNVDYGRITIRHQKTRWGSCTGRGNLNFNCLLMLAPREVLEYVVVHELAHRKEMNHSAKFWRIVSEVKPDYMHAKLWLREKGTNLIQ